MFFRLSLVPALAAAVAGCAQSSGALQMGPDTFNLSVHAAPARGGETGAKRLAFEEAAAKCAGMNRELLVKNVSSGPSSHFAGGTVDIIFRCLPAGDPELIRPRYDAPPSVVIEDRRAKHE